MATSVAAAQLPRKEANVLKGHEGAVLAVRFNGDGNYCLSCGKDRTIRLWNPHRGIHIKTYKYHGREVRDDHVTSDNAKLCSCEIGSSFIGMSRLGESSVNSVGTMAR